MPMKMFNFRRRLPDRSVDKNCNDSQHDVSNESKDYRSNKWPWPLLHPVLWNCSSRNRIVILIIGIACFVFRPLRNITFIMLCRSVTLYLQSRNSEEVALWRGSILQEKIPPLHASTSINLIVSHCDLSIDWIFTWAAPVEFNDIIIFSKIGRAHV